MTPETLKAALTNGKLTMAVLDEKCRRILRTALQFGWLDREQTITSIPVNNSNADKVALEESLESITLLKNDGGLLPLDPKRMKPIAVIGPEASAAVVGGGGSSQTTPFKADSFVAGMMSVAGDRIKVFYVPGLPPLGTIFSRTSFRNLKIDVKGTGEASDRFAKDSARSGRGAGHCGFRRVDGE